MHALAVVAADPRPRGQATFEKLVIALKNSALDNQVRLDAAQALAWTNTSVAAQVLVEQSLENSLFNPYLKKMGDLATPAIGYWAERRQNWAIEMLYEIGTPYSARLLIPFLWDKENEIQYACAWYLSSLLSQPNIADSLKDYEFGEVQNTQPILTWLWVPFSEDAETAIPVIAGRIGYIIRNERSEILPKTPISSINESIILPLILSDIQVISPRHLYLKIANSRDLIRQLNEVDTLPITDQEVKQAIEYLIERQLITNDEGKSLSSTVSMDDLEAQLQINPRIDLLQSEREEVGKKDKFLNSRNEDVETQADSTDVSDTALRKQLESDIAYFEKRAVELDQIRRERELRNPLARFSPLIKHVIDKIKDSHGRTNNMEWLIYAKRALIMSRPAEYMFDRLSLLSQERCIELLISGKRPPTEEDWKNLRRPIQYEFSRSWDARVLVFWILITGGLALTTFILGNGWGTILKDTGLLVTTLISFLSLIVLILLSVYLVTYGRYTITMPHIMIVVSLLGFSPALSLLPNAKTQTIFAITFYLFMSQLFLAIAYALVLSWKGLSAILVAGVFEIFAIGSFFSIAILGISLGILVLILVIALILLIVILVTDWRDFLKDFARNLGIISSLAFIGYVIYWLSAILFNIPFYWITSWLLQKYVWNITAVIWCVWFAVLGFFTWRAHHLQYQAQNPYWDILPHESQTVKHSPRITNYFLYRLRAFWKR
jgi:HEAT repeat protein